MDLIVYPKGQNERLINPSPFCSKTEIFLKLTQQNFKIKEFNGNPGKFPNKKLPVLRDEGNLIPDSSLIQKYIEQRFNPGLDNHLNEVEKSQGFTYSKMLEEYFYWALLYERWGIDSNWENLKNDFFGHIPALVRGVITTMIRKSTLDSAFGHGMGRHDQATILKLGKECIEHFANFLKGKTFLLGDKVSSYDSTAYAFASSVLHSNLGPVFKEEASKHKVLVDYDQRMFELIYSN